MRDPFRINKSNGFSLIEMMIALAILSFGLLAVAMLISSAARSDSVARSKSTAATAAQNMIENLADLYYRNPLAEDLVLGNHGPRQTEVLNPVDGTVLNRYNINWVIEEVADPRMDKSLDARLVKITITPINHSGEDNSRSPLNKALSMGTILGPGIR
jgi:prepilin-type N-terminal cleavage/methylation domain-containing protein